MQSWRPDRGECKAVVVIMHGGINYCDMEMYDRLAAVLVDSGYSAYSYDQRGFGRSEGRRMHMRRWEDFRGDFTSFLRLVRTLEPNKPVFAYGISFGACLVVDQAIVSPHLLRGIIAASFSTRPVNMPAAALKALMLIGKLFPKKNIPAEPQESFAGAREKMEGTKLWLDPLCHPSMTMGFPARLFKRQGELANELRYLTIPVLHQQGLEDDITLPDVSIRRKIGSEDYTYIEYPSTGHVIFKGANPKKVMDDICIWLNERSKLT